jgi:5-methylcytosine-specific restriction endonuclease McrA
MRARSKKTERVYRTQRRELVRSMLEEHPQCQIAWDQTCTRQATTVHELLKRSRGGSITDRDNCITACTFCNGAVEDYPIEAHLRGFAKHSWEVS